MKSRVSRVILPVMAAGLLAAIFRNGNEVPVNQGANRVGRAVRRERVGEQPESSWQRHSVPHDTPSALREAEKWQDSLDGLGEMIRKDARLAFAMASDLPPGPEREDLMLRAIREWAIADPLPAIAQAKNTAGESLRERLLASALIEWSQTDPTAAAGAATLELREGRIQDDAIVSICQRWAQSSTDDVGAWINSFPSGELQDAARDSVGNLASPR